MTKKKAKLPKRPTIDELEKLLNAEEDVAIEILPSGQIRTYKGKPKVKPLTMRENLGGEYAVA